MRISLSVVVGAAWLLAALPASSHHSFAAEFDVNRPIAFTGTVTRVEWTNPHAWIYLEVDDGQGNAQSWAVELLGINALIRRGLTHDSITAGNVLTIKGFGARDGTNTGNASVVTLTETGERLWASAAEEND